MDKDKKLNQKKAHIYTTKRELEIKDNRKIEKKQTNTKKLNLNS